MGGTKFIVLQLKDLIKGGIFAVIGLILIIALIYFFVPKGSGMGEEANTNLFNPGTYSSEITLHNTPSFNLEVTVTENEIVSVQFADLTAEHSVFYPLLEPTMSELTEVVLNRQTTNIEAIEGSELTGRVLLHAINTALAQAELSEYE